jgi:hypothetical protein
MATIRNIKGRISPDQVALLPQHPGQAVTFPGLICSYSAPRACKVSQRLISVCKPSQNSAVVSKNRAKRNAVSGVIARLPRRISLRRTRVMPSLLARSFWLKPKGSKNSYRRISPGGVGRRLWGNITFSCQWYCTNSRSNTLPSMNRKHNRQAPLTEMAHWPCLSPRKAWSRFDGGASRSL